MSSSAKFLSLFLYYNVTTGLNSNVNDPDFDYCPNRPEKTLPIK
jgi:hypothetical protein